MASSDNVQAFLTVMAIIQRLAFSGAAQSIPREINALKKRDRDNCTMIERLMEENHQFFDSQMKEIDRVKQSLVDINEIAEDRERELGERSGRLAQPEQNMVGLTGESKDDAYVCRPIQLVLDMEINHSNTTVSRTRWYGLWTSVHRLATTFFSVDLDMGTMPEAHN